MKFESLLLLGSMAVLGAAFTSCSTESDVFNKEANEAKLKSEYQRNFEIKYGPINPNQTWDFTSMNPVHTLPSTGSAGTRGDEVNVSVEFKGSGKMSIGSSVINWMHTNMQAGKNNTKMGSPFFMVTQRNSFTIVPMYQGKATYYWELWMNIGGQDTKIWSKYTNMKYKTADNQWHTLTTDGVPAEAVEIDAPTYTYLATENIKMYFYLKVWKTDQDYYDGKTAWKSKVSSLEEKMLALKNIDVPTNVPEGNDVFIIGCEDGTDKDYEDLVFMMYGKPAPPVEHVDEVEVRETKRYMMEDLGSTDDFDFNDVVVDVSNVHMKKVTYKYDSNGALVFESEVDIPGSHYQEAIVRAAGGTLNFTLEIGTNTITRWTKSPTYTTTDMLNTGWNGTPIHYSGKLSELAKFRIENNDWNPTTNNIKVIVEGNGSSGTVQTITFPKQGEAPMMIAVEDGTDWMTERTSVPDTWWYE